MRFCFRAKISAAHHEVVREFDVEDLRNFSTNAAYKIARHKCPQMHYAFLVKLAQFSR